MGARVVEKRAAGAKGDAMQRHRDMGINRIEARRGQCCYGMGLGIIIVDDVYPGFLGDVRNASDHPFPI
jgi:hypothetical protein